MTRKRWYIGIVAGALMILVDCGRGCRLPRRLRIKRELGHGGVR